HKPDNLYEVNSRIWLNIVDFLTFFCDYVALIGTFRLISYQIKGVRLQEQTGNIKIDDQFLVAQAQQGDSAALAKLILRYQDRIFNTILKICGNYQDAAELTQETFVKLIEKVGTFKGQSSFYTWLFRIAVNLTLNYCKRRGKVKYISLDKLIGADGQSGKKELVSFLKDKSMCDPAELTEKKEIEEILLGALERLDDKCRTIIVLRDIEDMSYEQISDALDIELGTVKSRLSRSRMRLRRIMEKILK
ncbi:MAG: sigma-70 family RNA polymerase sigma factor, partial [Planctomycetes bacterium]|nr:sigma-70 family RNA polymerase sigma factor [Planctomycetota bacterium]